MIAEPGDRVNFVFVCPRSAAIVTVVTLVLRRHRARLDIVTATIKANRVASFKLWFGGAGD